MPNKKHNLRIKVKFIEKKNFGFKKYMSKRLLVEVFKQFELISLIALLKFSIIITYTMFG